jgi:hypothetical protein
MRWWLVQTALYDQDSQAQDAAVYHRRLDVPMEVGLFCTMGIVFRADVITDQLQQFPGAAPFLWLTPPFDRAAVLLYSIAVQPRTKR